jgi:hypothetical protein
MRLGSIPSASIFWKELWGADIISFLNIWCKSLVKPSGPGAIVGRLLIINIVSLIDIEVFSLPFISLCIRSDSLYLSTNQLISFRLGNLWA